MGKLSENCVLLQGNASKANLDSWEIFASDYIRRAVVSDDDIHYGLCLPGERDLKLLPPLQGRRVLDVGCGAGENSRALARLGASVVAIEPVLFLSDRARDRLSDVPGARVLSAPWEGGRHASFGPYDLVLFVGSSEYIPLDRKFFGLLNEITCRGASVVMARMHPIWTTLYCHETEVEARGSYFDIGRIDEVVYGDQRLQFYRFHYSAAEIVRRFSEHGWSLRFLAEPSPVPPERAPFYMTGCYEDPILVDRMRRFPMTLVIGFGRG